MKAKITKVISGTSRTGQPTLLICMKTDKGLSCKTWSQKNFGNFNRWFRVADWFRAGDEVWLDNLTLINKSLVDADSLFTILHHIPKTFIPQTI